MPLWQMGTPKGHSHPAPPEGALPDTGHSRPARPAHLPTILPPRSRSATQRPPSPLRRRLAQGQGILSPHPSSATAPTTTATAAQPRALVCGAPRMLLGATGAAMSRVLATENCGRQSGQQGLLKLGQAK